MIGPARDTSSRVVVPRRTGMGQQVQRLAAYAVIVRGDRILLTRLAERVTKHELWTLPGGGVDHGEDPRAAVVREVYEETGLRADVGEIAHVFSMHLSDTWRRGRRVDAHSVRIVYDGWVASDAQPRVIEIDGSTADAAWQPLADVMDGTLPTAGLVTEALAAVHPHRLPRDRPERHRAAGGRGRRHDRRRRLGAAHRDRCRRSAVQQPGAGRDHRGQPLIPRESALGWAGERDRLHLRGTGPEVRA